MLSVERCILCASETPVAYTNGTTRGTALERSIDDNADKHGKGLAEMFREF